MRQPELRSVPGLLSAQELQATVDAIAAAQQPTGSLPWPDGHTDAWDHVECAMALTNTYYLARMMRSNNPEDRAIAEKVGVVFPNQASWGTHVNIAGGAVAKHSKNLPQALAFLEYLASPEAQEHFANGHTEWPAAIASSPSEVAAPVAGP